MNGQAMNRRLLPDSAIAEEFIASPNHNERRGFRHPEYVILHYTGMPTSKAAIALLRDPKAEVSSHYVVEEDGRILQLTPESGRAWHAPMTSRFCFAPATTDVRVRSQTSTPPRTS